MKVFLRVTVRVSKEATRQSFNVWKRKRVMAMGVTYRLLTIMGQTKIMMKIDVCDTIDSVKSNNFLLMFKLNLN